ncbi:MAG: peroxiredoxin [Gammaproteobacteria bacterium]
MNYTIKRIFSRLFLFTGMISANAVAEIEVGQPAPDFRLPDQHRKIHSLSEYAGKWVVLYFYPKDDTPGCTTEACNFRDDIFRLRELGAEVLGVSVDSPESHARFAEKHGLPFSLLADTEGRVAESYGSLRRIGPLRLAKRHTFIIDPQGRVAKIYRKVDPKAHSDAVIADIQSLQTQ